MEDTFPARKYQWGLIGFEVDCAFEVWVESPGNLRVWGNPRGELHGGLGCDAPDDLPAAQNPGQTGDVWQSWPNTFTCVQSVDTVHMLQTRTGNIKAPPPPKKGGIGPFTCLIHVLDLVCLL